MKLRRMGLSFCLALFAACLCFAGSDVKQEMANIHGDNRSVLEAGNDIYRIFMQDDPSTNVMGTYTAGTGPGHGTPGLNIFYSGYYPATNPWSTYLTIRSFTSQTDYVSRLGTPSSGYTVVNIGDDPAPGASVTKPDDRTLLAAWELTNGTDNLLVEQLITVIGSTKEDSKIMVETTITNLNPAGGESVEIGVRYLWDLMIDQADNAFIRMLPGGSWLTNFTDFIYPNYEYFETTDDTLDPTFSILGTIMGDPSIIPPAVEPDTFVYGFWPKIYDEAWEYTLDGTPGDDSCVLYYWGYDIPILITPESSYTTRAYLWTEYEEQEPPPTQVPTLDEWGSLILIALLGALIVLKRRA